MTTIQIRIDEQTKKSSKKILDELGMDMSSAIKVYLKQLVICKGIPFKLLTANGLTLAEEQEILEASAEAKMGLRVRKVKNLKEMKTHLNSLKSSK